MATSETTKGVVYNAGRRVATIERVCTRSDDCADVGRLYYRLSDIYRRLEGEISEGEREALEADLAQVNSELRTALSYLDGYETEGE